jgi:type IX secretion system PorP/SprF family membrane protein
MKGHKKHTMNTTAALLAMLALVLLCPFGSYAQQDPVYSQYMNNQLSVNPAYAGVRGVGSVSAITRKQWIGIEGSPFTSSLTLDMPFDSLAKVGGGIDFMYDNNGPVTTTALFFDYAYRIRASENTTLSFGLKAGLNYLQANLTQLDRYHLDDFYIIDYGDFSQPMANVGVGLFWFGDNFYAGFSVPRMLQNRYHRNAMDVQAASREERHYFINGAYFFKLSPSLTFKPSFSSILVAGAPATANFDFAFLMYDRFWAGTTYRISDAVGAYVHFQLENMKVGFAYEYPLTSLGYYTTGTVEVMLRFDFKTSKSQAFPSPAF